MHKKALIVGVSGQDGAHLAELLLGKGYSVFGTSRDANICSFNNLRTLGVLDKIRTLSTSPADFHSVIQTLKTVMPDEVYNLSGQSSVGLSFEQPKETFSSIGIANLTWLEALRFLGGRIKYYNAGSSESFGNTDEPATESTPFRPRSPYAVAKATAFWQVVNYREAYNMYACSGVLFNHESTLRPERFVTQKIVRAACRIASGYDEILNLGNIEIKRDWGWSPEYVDAMWRMLQMDTPDDYVIATGVTCSLKEFISEVFSSLGLNWEDHVKSDESLIRPSEIMISRACPDKAKDVLQWKATISTHQVARLLVAGELERLQRVKKV